MFALITCIQHCTISSQCNKARKGTEKQRLTRMIVYRENPQKSNKQLIESVNELSKVTLQNSVVLLFISNKELENENF